MRIKYRWLSAISVLIIVYLLLQFLPYNHDKQQSVFNRKNQEYPFIIAHGGAKKLYPENTILAFENSLALGVDALEMDIRLTSDNILCTIHDEDISHYTNHQGKVQDYTYEELSLFNFGYYFIDSNHNYVYRNSDDERLIPARIDQLFHNYGKSTYYILEIKETGRRGKQAVKQLYDLIVHYDLIDYVCIASFDHEVMMYFKKINKANVSGVMDYEYSKDFVIANYGGFNRFEHYSMDGLMLPLVEQNIELDDWYLINKIHEQGLFVFYWTIDDKKNMQSLIKKGVDGIITDRPDLLLQILRENK